MLRLCAANRRQRHSSIQSDQASTLFDRQRQQIGIGHLAVTQQPISRQTIRLQQVDGIWPEGMSGMLHGLRQSLGNLRSGYGVRVGGVGENTNTTVLSQRTRGSALINVGNEPVRGQPVMEMTGVEQRDQDIHIQQRSHQTPQPPAAH